MNVPRQAVTAICPDCTYEIDLGVVPNIGDRITCPNCWASLEVVSVDPLTLVWETVESEEDWESGSNQ